MKKATILMLSLLFVLSVPLISLAQEPDEGYGALDEPEAACQSMDHHGAPEHMRPGMGMEGKRGRFGGGFMMGCRLPGFYLRHAKELKLSDEQVSSLKKISFELRKDMVARIADVKVKKLELREILDKPDYKLEDATAKLKEIEDARLALETSALQHSTQARDVLTPDQLKNAKELCRNDRCGGSCGKGMRHMGKGK